MGWDASKTDPLKWAAKMKDAPRDAINIFAFAVFSRVVEHTPVDTGACRQNWLVTINSETDEYDLSRGKGGRVMSNGGKVIEGAKGDDTIYIQNNVPYAKTIEYGWYGKWEGDKFTPANTDKVINGFSKQYGAKGMVGTTLAKADHLWERAVKAAKGE